MNEERPTSSKGTDEEHNKSESQLETIRKLLVDKLNLNTADDDDDHAAQKVIEDLTFDGLTKHWKAHGFKNVVTMVGAGISTSAGIPDFRTPGSGLYDNLQKYNLRHPTAIFEMDYFHYNPKPFFALAKELYPGNFNPTPAHYFVRLLHEKGLLRRHYTQNIDTLERIAGIPEEKLVEAHGTFYTNHCLGCRKLFSMAWMKQQIFADKLPKCDKCRSLVKPDIVFFGENLPQKFYTLPSGDFDKCDLLIIMGTSLEVQPFASLIDHTGPRCMRLLINRTMVGNDNSGSGGWFKSDPGLLYDNPKNTRDVAFIGDCDDGIMALAEALGWRDELSALIKSENARLQRENAAEKQQQQDSQKAKQQTKIKAATSAAVASCAAQSTVQNESNKNKEKPEMQAESKRETDDCAAHKPDAK